MSMVRVLLAAGWNEEHCMYAVSVKQPYANAIASGNKTREYRSWAPRTFAGMDLLIVASRTPGERYAGEPVGVAICVVRVTKIIETNEGYAWCLSDPRPVEPLPLRGYAALFTVDETRLTYRAEATILTPKEAGAEKTATLPPPPRRSRRKPLPYTFSIGDRMLRGERAGTPKKARAHALALARRYNVPITIHRDGIAISGEGP